MNETENRTIRDTPKLPEVWPGWETVRILGHGSFGAVYEIQRDIFGSVEKAAVKCLTIPQNYADIEVLYEDGLDEGSITARFEGYLRDIVKEYSLMARLKGHSNIVSCEDVRYVQQDNGIGWDIYIKMELLTSLPKAMKGETEEKEIIRLGMDICTALELCRGQNIIHRDIKPQNIFISEAGEYKLGDFGIAKTAERTTTGTKTGTYRFMAPEVYNNRPYGAAVDIYSLGMVLYWLLNERRTPFLPLPPAVPTARMEDEARDRRMRGESFAPPQNGSEALKRIVMKAVAFEPKERYSDPSEMKAALAALLQPKAPVLTETEQPQPKEKPHSEELPAVEDDSRTVFAPRQKEEPPRESAETRLHLCGERMEAALAASDWTTADAEAQELLKLDSRNARAYLVRFLCAVECRALEEYSRKLLADTEEAAYEQRTDSFEELRAPLLGRLASYGSEARKALGKELPPATYPSCVRSRREQRQQAEKCLSDQYLKWAGTCDPGVKADIERIRSYTLSVMDSRLKQAETEEYGAMLEAKTAYRKALSAWEADYTEKHRQTEAPKPVTYTPEPPRAPAGPVGESHASAPADSRKKRGASLWLFVLLIGAIIVGAYYWDVTAAPHEASAREISTNTAFIYVPNDSGITITGYEGELPAELILPSEIDGKKVTRIGSLAFYPDRNLISVTVPEGVTSIEHYAFAYCSHLKSVSIPADCKYEITAFPSSCTVIRRPAETAQTMNANAVFTYSSNDSGITITGYEGVLPAELILPGEIDGQKVTAIGSTAFFKCSSLISVTIPDGVTSIGSSAFRSCYALTSVTIPQGVTSIRDCAFYNCYDLTNVAIPDSVKSIGAFAFYGCYDLTSVTIPDGVTSISSSAFHHCCSLESVTISDGVTSIGNCAFSNCESLTNVNIPDSVTIIGIYAFDGCESLTRVTIPASCKVGADAFPSSCTVIRR